MPKRRANGEGNIRKRKDGRWEGRYTAGHDPETGKQIFKNVLGKTQAEVKEKLKKAMETVNRIDVTRSGQYTVGEWAELWYENYAKPSVREGTAAYYKNYIDHHIVPNIGSIKLDKLTTLDIQKFYNKMKSSGRVQRFKEMKSLGLSNKTVRGLHTMFHGCLEQAVTERLIPLNPTLGCRLPAKDKREMKVIQPEQIGIYLSAAEEWGVLPMFYLELTSGLRRGELLALLWTDVDTKNCTVSVTKSVNRINGALKVSTPKTVNSVRTVTIPQQAVDLLIREHDQHPENPYLFPSPVTGTMYGPECVGRIHKKLLKKAGVEENIRFHDLRHTFATLALQNGVDIKTLSGMLGHYSAGFTLDTYTHITTKMQKEAAEKMGGFMSQAM
jgi:integrase